MYIDIHRYRCVCGCYINKYLFIYFTHSLSLAGDNIFSYTAFFKIYILSYYNSFLISCYVLY